MPMAESNADAGNGGSRCDDARANQNAARRRMIRHGAAMINDRTRGARDSVIGADVSAVNDSADNADQWV